MNLIETKKSILRLIKEAESTFAGTGRALLDIEDYVAEYLAANGVIVPPCKVGDVVYCVAANCHNIKDKEYCKVTGCYECPHDTTLAIVERIITTYDLFCLLFSEYHEIALFNCEAWGKTVFPTREEAEQALKERSEK